MTILITGPESSGKTTLARNVAWALDGYFVAEAARDYLNERAGEYTLTDLPIIWAKQQEAEAAARATSASFILCDTGPEVIRVWAEVKFGTCPAEILRATSHSAYDLILLCTPDLPWVPDPLRETPAPEQRQHLFERYRELLPAEKTQVISGTARLAAALHFVDLALAADP